MSCNGTSMMTSNGLVFKLWSFEKHNQGFHNSEMRIRVAPGHVSAFWIEEHFVTKNFNTSDAVF